MPQIINNLLSQLASLLGPLSPFAKAVIPAGLGVADILVNLIFTGALDTTDLTGALSAFILAAVAYLVPNKPAPVAK